jgi:hypothetical protein
MLVLDSSIIMLATWANFYLLERERWSAEVFSPAAHGGPAKGRANDQRLTNH